MKTTLNTEKLKQLRHSHGWSQERLAEKAKISLRTVQRIENGNHATFDTISAIAAAFQVSNDDLIENQTEKLEQAKQTAERENLANLRISFITHIASYLFVIALLVAINLAKSPERLWVVWPAIGWGIGVLAHGMTLWIAHESAKK